MVPLDNGVKPRIGDAYAGPTVLAVSNDKLTVVAEREYLVIVRLCAEFAVEAIVLRLGRFKLLK